MNPLFIRRECCPTCRSGVLDTLYSCPYSNPPVSTFLLRYYGPRLNRQDLQGMAGADYTLVECRTCGLIFQRDIPSDALMETLYERWIDVDASRIKSESAHGIQYFSGMAQEIARVVSYLGGHPSDLQVLDFGMGWGNWSRMAQAHGCRVVGMETSPSRLEYVSARGIRCLSYSEIATESFDFIHTEQVFEHLADPAGTLDYLVERLRPGGLIKISVPNGWEIKQRLSQLDWEASRGSPDSVMPVQPLEHINCFHQGAIVYMAAASGLVPADLRSDDSHPVVIRLRHIKRRIRALCGILTGGQHCADPGSTCLYFTPG